MEELFTWIMQERDMIFPVLLFLFIFAVYRLFLYEMRRKDKLKGEEDRKKGELMEDGHTDVDNTD